MTRRFLFRLLAAAVAGQRALLAKVRPTQMVTTAAELPRLRPDDKISIRFDGVKTGPVVSWTKVEVADGACVRTFSLADIPWNEQARWTAGPPCVITDVRTANKPAQAMTINVANGLPVRLHLGDRISIRFDGVKSGAPTVCLELETIGFPGAKFIMQPLLDTREQHLWIASRDCVIRDIRVAALGPPAPVQWYVQTSAGEILARDQFHG